MNDRYMEIVKKLDGAMQGENVNQAIPAMAGYLCNVGAWFGVDREEFITFLTETADNVFNDFQARKS